MYIRTITQKQIIENEIQRATKMLITEQEERELSSSCTVIFNPFLDYQHTSIITEGTSSNLLKYRKNSCTGMKHTYISAVHPTGITEAIIV